MFWVNPSPIFKGLKLTVDVKSARPLYIEDVKLAFAPYVANEMP